MTQPLAMRTNTVFAGVVCVCVRARIPQANAVAFLGVEWTRQAFADHYA